MEPIISQIYSVENSKKTISPICKEEILIQNDVKLIYKTTTFMSGSRLCSKIQNIFISEFKDKDVDFYNLVDEDDIEICKHFLKPPYKNEPIQADTFNDRLNNIMKEREMFDCVHKKELERMIEEKEFVYNIKNVNESLKEYDNKRNDIMSEFKNINVDKYKNIEYPYKPYDKNNYEPTRIYRI